MVRPVRGDQKYMLVFIASSCADEQSILRIISFIFKMNLTIAGAGSSHLVTCTERRIPVLAFSSLTCTSTVPVQLLVFKSTNVAKQRD